MFYFFRPYMCAATSRIPLRCELGAVWSLGGHRAGRCNHPRIRWSTRVNLPIEARGCTSWPLTGGTFSCACSKTTIYREVPRNKTVAELIPVHMGWGWRTGISYRKVQCGAEEKRPVVKKTFLSLSPREDIWQNWLKRGVAYTNWLGRSTATQSKHHYLFI